MSGLGGGTGHGGGEPGHAREYSNREHGSRREPYGKGKDYKQVKDEGKERSYKRDGSTYLPTCHECGVKGHIRPECPNRVASVKNAGHSKGRILLGRIGVNPCTMTLDSGADNTVVRADLVAEADYTGNSIRVGDYYGCWRNVPMAKVWIGIGDEFLFKHEVLVVPRDCPHEVLLGNDLDIFDHLYELAQGRGESDPQVKAITRGQAKRQGEIDIVDRALDTRDGAQPVQCQLDSGVPNVSKSKKDVVGRKEVAQVEVASEDVREVSVLEEDAQGGERVEVSSEEEYENGITVDGLDTGKDVQGADLPLPDMVGGEGDRKLLIEEQSNDDSLKEIWQWAVKGEKGYALENGILVHILVTPSEQVRTRIVVPSNRRAALLKAAHSSMLGGHFSHVKTTELLNRKFTWPRMSVDVKKLCSQCVPCQKASRAGVEKVPLQPLPVLDIPFSKLAFDLVGPLPRTKSGYKYLLTSICLANTLKPYL